MERITRNNMGQWALKLTPRSDVNPVQTEHVRLSSAIRVVSNTNTFSHPASSPPGIGNTGAVRFDIAVAQAVERQSCQGEFLSERSEVRFPARLIRWLCQDIGRPLVHALVCSGKKRAELSRKGTQLLSQSIPRRLGARRASFSTDRYSMATAGEPA